MIGYVAKFIPNLAEITKPLRVVLKKAIAWHWLEEQKEAFEKFKMLLYYLTSRRMQIGIRGDAIPK